MVTSEIVEAANAGAPIGPGDGEESAFLAEQNLSGPAVARISPPVEAQDATSPLPPMDELIQRIPASTRELMDQLFRAKFVTVKRLPAAAFKTQI